MPRILLRVYRFILRLTFGFSMLCVEMRVALEAEGTTALPLWIFLWLILPKYITHSFHLLLRVFFPVSSAALWQSGEEEKQQSERGGAVDTTDADAEQDTDVDVLNVDVLGDEPSSAFLPVAIPPVCDASQPPSSGPVLDDRIIRQVATPESSYYWQGQRNEHCHRCDSGGQLVECARCNIVLHAACMSGGAPSPPLGMHDVLLCGAECAQEFHSCVGVGVGAVRVDSTGSPVVQAQVERAAAAAALGAGAVAAAAGTVATAARVAAGAAEAVEAVEAAGAVETAAAVSTVAAGSAGAVSAAAAAARTGRGIAERPPLSRVGTTSYPALALLMRRGAFIPPRAFAPFSPLLLPVHSAELTRLRSRGTSGCHTLPASPVSHDSGAAAPRTSPSAARSAAPVTRGETTAAHTAQSGEESGVEANSGDENSGAAFPDVDPMSSAPPAEPEERDWDAEIMAQVTAGNREAARELVRQPPHTEPPHWGE